MIVADTNLLVYLLVEGDQTQSARACAARDPYWRAPAIWRHEFLNALAQHVRVRGLPVDHAIKALAAADEIVETDSLRGLEERVLVVASSRAISSYDAEFIAAAEAADVPLVTADQKLIDRSDGRAVSIAEFAKGK